MNITNAVENAVRPMKIVHTRNMTANTRVRARRVQSVPIHTAPNAPVSPQKNCSAPSVVSLTWK